MFTIGKLYHIVHVVDDLDTVERWYDGVFSPKVLKERGYMEAAMREAYLAAIGGNFIIEPLVSPPVPGVERSAAYKFKARFGRHLHSIAWHVHDGVETYRTLREHGLRVYDMAGNLLEATPEPEVALYTHPRETFGALEFAPLAGWRDRRAEIDWDPYFWRDQHPLGIECLSHITVAVRDLDRGRDLYTRVLGGTVIHEESGPTRRSAFIAVGEDTVVELAQPLSDETLLGQELARNGEITHALVFKVQGAGAAERYLMGKGLRVRDRSDGGFTLDPRDAFDAVYQFTQRALPGDPRF